MKMLRDAGVDFHTVNYYLKTIGKSKLKTLIHKMGKKPKDLLRTSEPIYKKLKLAKRNLSDNQIVNLIVKHPDLLQRPIIEKGKRAILARPPESLKKIL